MLFMRQSFPIDADWTEEELELLNLFGGKCILCRTRQAVTLHEILPKSKNIKHWKDPENRVPVCNECHDTIHRRGARKFATLLKQRRMKTDV